MSFLPWDFGYWPAPILAGAERARSAPVGYGTGRSDGAGAGETPQGAGGLATSEGAELNPTMLGPLRGQRGRPEEVERRYIALGYLGALPNLDDGSQILAAVGESFAFPRRRERPQTPNRCST